MKKCGLLIFVIVIAAYYSCGDSVNYDSADSKKAEAIKAVVDRYNSTYKMGMVVNENVLARDAGKINLDSLETVLDQLSAIYGVYKIERSSSDSARCIMQMTRSSNNKNVTYTEYYTFQPESLDYGLEGKCTVIWSFDLSSVKYVSANPYIEGPSALNGSGCYSGHYARQKQNYSTTAEFGGEYMYSIYQGLVTIRYMVSGFCSIGHGEITWSRIINV